jgi:hypothetical protein
MNGFCRTDIHTGLAVNTHILVHFGLFIFHGDCRCRAFTHAGFASGTLGNINDCYQLVHSIVYVLQKTKKGFRLYLAGGFLKTGLFFQVEHIAHAVDTGFFAHNPPGCMDRPAGKDRAIGRMVREFNRLKIL